MIIKEHLLSMFRGTTGMIISVLSNKSLGNCASPFTFSSKQGLSGGNSGSSIYMGIIFSNIPYVVGLNEAFILNV